MYKACSNCGKIHPMNHICYKQRTYESTDERKLRSTSKWTKKSVEIRESANYLCEVCLDQGVINYDKIEVHHITKVGQDKSKLLENDNLICLCPPHHKQADRGEIDTDYLLTLVARRESKP